MTTPATTPLVANTPTGTNPLPADPLVGKVTGREEVLANWAGPYVTSMMGRAQALSMLPYQTYQGPLTAGTSPLQQQAFQGIGSLGVPSDITSAATTAGNVARTAGGMGFTPSTFTNQFTSPAAFAANPFTNVGFNAPTAYSAVGQDFTSPGVAQQYMNPFLQQVLQPQLQAMQRQADIQRGQIGAQAARLGAFGGARSGLMNQQLNAELMRQQQQAIGQGYGQAFQQAQQQFTADQARRVQEAQFGAQQGMTGAELAARYGLEAARAAEASRQFGAQQAMTGAELGARYGLEAQRAAEASRQFGTRFGLEALQQQLAAAQLQGQLGGQQANLAQQIANQQLAAGAQQRAIEQEGITADLNEFLQQRDYPMRQVQFLQSMLQGLPISAVSQSYQQPSGLSQFLGGSSGILGILRQIGVIK